MSTVEEELEEGEITDSDSMGVEDQSQTLPQPAKPAVQQYSIFDNQPRTASSTKPGPHHLHSESDASSSDDDEDDDHALKKQKFHDSRANSKQSKPFVNPNYVRNGSAMPPLPKQTNRTIWGSVLQEQILTAQVGNFSMEKKVTGDREVESYDFTRAKEDSRPFPVEDEMKTGEEDLFGEVIDLEKSACKQKKTLKRRHYVGDRLGRRQNVKERLQLPKVTENSSVEDVTYFISNKLRESKVHLIRRVVEGIGQAKALGLLKKTEEVEASGGMLIMNGSRRRTPGGVYLTLLKTGKEATKEQLEFIFEEENKWSLELKKRKRARGRRRKQEQERWRKEAAGESKANSLDSMDLVEDPNSRSSVEGQTGSPKNPADHFSDTQESFGGRDQDHDNSHSEGEIDNKSDPEDFQTQLSQERERQAKEEEAKDIPLDDDAITLDDVLDIGVDEEFID